MNSVLKKIVLSILLFSFLTPCLAKAQIIKPPWTGYPKDFGELINTIIDFIFWVAIAVAPIMIIIAAFYFLTSAGNPDKVKTAKNIIFWTVVGLAIILLAKGIVSVIKQIIGG